MTLKEKFEDVTDPIEWDTDGVTPQEQYVLIADDFAIGFMNWFDALQNEYIAMLSAEKLLEIYKKEKGL